MSRPEHKNRGESRVRGVLRGAFVFIISFALVVVVAGLVGLNVGPYELLLGVALAAGVAVMLTHRSRPS